MMKAVRSPLFWLLAVLLCALPMVLQGADPAVDPAKLSAILGSDAANWTITGSPYTLTANNGLSTSGGTVIEGKTRIQAPMEYRFAFRLRQTEPYGSSFSVVVGKTDKQAFNCSISAAKGSDYFNYSISETPEADKPINGALYVKAVNERSLAWSEEMRKTIEAQMAASQKVEDIRCTLRLVLTKNVYKAWFNGRFIGQLKVKDDIDPSGNVSLTLYYGAELLSVQTMPYQATDARFFPVALDGFVNASALAAGQKVVKLPAPADQPTSLDGVTFRFPAPDAAGHDHLDMSPSWTRFGAISGYIFANYGTFGGRWISADRMDPSRFNMYVPYGNYKALHLIAAYNGLKDTVPTVSAQFYRPDAGHPMNFAGSALPYNTSFAKGIPVKLANGKEAKLFHVVIPIDPDKMAWFSDLPRVGLELTKAVQPYRAYPDPLEYSWHGAGLPSGVQIYAATLEKAAVEVDPQPDAVAHVWTAPAQPSYTINLRNNTNAAIAAKLAITTASYDAKDKTAQQATATIPANGTTSVKVALKPTLYGLQHLTVKCDAAGESYSYQRDFAFLHPDTRERGNWESKGKGPIYGYWGWGGGHGTPDAKTELIVMAQAGAETNLSTYQGATPEIIDLATKLKFTSHAGFSGDCMYVNGFSFTSEKYDPKNPEATAKYLIEEEKKRKVEPSALNVPEYMPFFPEPQIGRITSGIWPTWYGEKDYQLPKEDEAYFQNKLELFLLGARAVKKEWPDTKILLPYGDPMYTDLFLRRSPEARELIDGCALDLPCFERLPEQQINQVVLNRLYPIFNDIKQFKKDPYFVVIEGPCMSGKDYDTTPELEANITTRNFLALIGYGVNNHESANAPFDCSNYWGENHYGGGWCTRLPLAMPKLSYVSYATLTRHTNRCNFVKYVTTGSTSVYCQQYKHYRDGHQMDVLWTIRGNRPVTMKVQPTDKIVVYDVNDNPLPLVEKAGTVTFNISQAPVYLEGLTAEPEITLGESDHSDAVPARVNVKLTNIGDGSWTLQAKHDEEYENTNKLQIERFLGNMTAAAVAAPKAQGGKALAVHLGQQEIDRKLMPYYTTFVPKAPITIPGKASHLGLWVKASSDWGRVVYCLRDAKGEKWINVGTKDDWNGDDMRCWSAFAFDGWRYLQFEAPSSAPYDSYRELGTSCWGSYNGDGIVDLPLTLDKIIVERRSSVIYGNDLVPAKADDVLLGDLYAEYAGAADKTPEAVRQSKLRMPIPAGSPTIENPIADLAKTGVGAPTTVLRVEDPAHMYDGTRCLVYFTAVDGAKDYDIWVSPYQDGRGAMKMAANVQPGATIEGLRPDTDFFVFVTYTDKDGKVAKPSQPLKIKLKNRFLYQ